MPAERMDQVNSLLQQQISSVIAREVEFPDKMFATIQRVETSRDLRFAKVFVSIIPFEKRKDGLKILVTSRKHIATEVGAHVELRSTPKIIFVLDETSETASEIEAVLDKIKKEQSND